MLNECKTLYSMSFFDLKNCLRYKTCQVARPKRHNIEKIEKYSTRELVDSFVSRISSSRWRMNPKSLTIASDKSSSRFNSTSKGFNLAASSNWKVFKL